jgi:hypothetical protein
MTKEFKFHVDVKYVRYEREEYSLSCETEAEAIELAKKRVLSMEKILTNEEYIENFILSEPSIDYFECISRGN